MNKRRHMLIPGDSVGALSKNGILDPRSCLPTRAFQQMKVQPEMLLKTHDRDHRTREYGIRGAHAPVTGYPGNMLKTKVRQSPITHHKVLFTNALAPDSCPLASLVQGIDQRSTLQIRSHGIDCGSSRLTANDAENDPT